MTVCVLHCVFDVVVIVDCGKIDLDYYPVLSYLVDRQNLRA